MDVFDKMRENAASVMARLNDINRSTLENGKGTEDVQTSLASLHAKVDALQVEQPAIVIDDTETTKPEQPESKPVIVDPKTPELAEPVSLAPIKSITARTDGGSVENLNTKPDAYPNGWFAKGDSVEMGVDLHEELRLDLVSILLHNPDNEPRVYFASIGGQRFEAVASLAADARETSRYNLRLPEIETDGFGILFEGNDREGNDWNGAYRVEVFTSSEIKVKAKAVDVVLPVDAKNRPLLVFPVKQQMEQENALPLKIDAATGTAEFSQPTQVEFSHEPSRQGAPVAESIGALSREMKKRPPLILIRGTAMRGRMLTLGGMAFDGIREGVTVIEPEHDGAVCPSMTLDDTSAFAVRGFKWQFQDWIIRGNGVCNSLLFSGIGWDGKGGKSPFAMNPPDQNRGVMENVVVQDVFLDYEIKLGYDGMIVIWAVANIGWRNSKTAHMRNCGTINLRALNVGDKGQILANNDAASTVPLAQINADDCFDIGGIGVSTFSKGAGTGNSSPEDGGLDSKGTGHNKLRPLRVLGNAGLGFGESGTSFGNVTGFHMTKGYGVSSNHLGIACNRVLGSTAHIDNSGCVMSHSHACGGVDYPHWRELGFDDYAKQKSPAAFVNYVDPRAANQNGYAKMHSNTAFMHPKVGNGGGRVLAASEVRELMLRLPSEFGQADSRLNSEIKIFVPKGVKELVW